MQILRTLFLLKNVKNKPKFNQMTDKERLNKVIEYVINAYPRVTNQREFADSIAVNSRSVNGAVTGRLAVAKSIWLGIIENYKEFSEEWLMFGRGSMMASDRAAAKIPILSHLRGSLDEYVIIPDFSKLGCDYMLRVGGDSMVPYANNGDLIACKKLGKPTFFQYGKVYVIDTEQGLLVKVVQKTADRDTVSLHSFNPAYADFEVAIADISEVAMVLGIVRME